MPHLPLVDPDRRLVVFWTPRCGSTTLLTWFFHAIGLADELRARSAHTLRAAWQKEHAPDPDGLRALYRDPGVRKVVVCRDPLDRVVSSYYLALTSTSSQWSAIRAERPGLDDARRLSFDAFLDYLEAIDLETCDLHWRLQSAQDWHRLGLDVDRFVRTESLDEDLEALGRDLGMTGPIRHASVTPRAEVAPPEGLPTLDLAELSSVLPQDERGRLRLPPADAFLAGGRRERVAAIYRRDLEALPYASPVA